MDKSDVQLVGGPCGQHGSYTFYKAFKYTKNGCKRIVTLSEFFFVKLWIDSDLLCIGELQLLWVDKNSDQVLASLRLYFLPENTPEGRMDHGEDEVLAISEKVVIKLEDLITWITVDAEWNWGRLAVCSAEVAPPIMEQGSSQEIPVRLSESSLDFSDVEKERRVLELQCEKSGPSVVILSYPRYCRFRAMMKRLENVENEFLKFKIVNALGGFTVITKHTRILFCRDTFDYPELEGHELLCNHLAPKLKGRPRGKRKKRSVSPGSESNESESSVSIVSAKITDGNGGGKRATIRNVETLESKEFLKKLYVFMKANQTPIGRIPSLGYKELDLYSFYTKVQKIGGYDSVTANRLWKSIFDDMSGHQNSTSAATVIRRHYERFLLPYERHIKGEEYKPLPVSERRRLKSKASSSISDNENSEGPSSSGKSTPVAQAYHPTTPTENKDFTMQIKTEAKTSSSLRSIRMKTQKDKQADKKEDFYIEAIMKKEVEKDMEPLTSAIAPVVQKIAADKNLSPVEGKENIPIIKTGATANPEILEIYKPKTPEAEESRIVDMQEVKKRKLDILKEGGLEVTPVRGFLGKDGRPSVIQQAVKPEWMPPPPGRFPRPKPEIVKKKPPPVMPFMNGTPPKVVQSKSIYSYSEKTVYGNPKDLMPAVAPVQYPQFPRSTGGDLLDLSVQSPQKPVVEITRIPQVSPTLSNFSNNNNNSVSNTPRNLSKALDGRRLGSNLEITLVDPKRGPYRQPVQPQPFPKPPQKRAPYPQKRFEENGRVLPQFPPSPYKKTLPEGYPKKADLGGKPHMGRTNSLKHLMNTGVGFPPGYPQPGFDSSKELPPFTSIEQMYYMALMNPSQLVVPFTNPEQMKLYTEQLAQISRYSFPVPPENPALNHYFKKP